jgi:hypothetical protein
MSETLRLCYVSGWYAYFTTRSVQEQWGDDWDDAPYEHNAGTPYEPCWHREERYRKPGEPLCNCTSCVRDWDGEKPRWKIVRVRFGGPFLQPCEGFYNSPHSVQQINSGVIPWLRSAWWDEHSQNVRAGATLQEFTERVLRAGGKVFDVTSEIKRRKIPAEV